MGYIMVNRFPRRRRDGLEIPNSDTLDHILDVVEPTLRAIAAEHGLLQNRIDRWRWDQPEVVLC